MTPRFELIVTDTSPLITLAKADALDLLLRPRWPIEIPDAVFVEATREHYEDGLRIRDWIQVNRDLIRIEPTEQGDELLILLAAGRKPRNLGEYAAMDVLQRFLARSADGHAILLYEDADVSRRRATLDPRISLVTTGALLADLEQAKIIQSADHILDLAAEAGRNVAGQRGADADSLIVQALLCKPDNEVT